MPKKAPLPDAALDEVHECYITPAYDGDMAEAYLNGGDTSNAVMHYRRSLELNPANANAKEMLKKLEKK